MAGTPQAVLVEKDPFARSLAGARISTGSTTAVSQHFVRRPMRGLQIKDETFATLSVNGPGRAPSLYNSALPENGQASFTSNFILQSVQESRMEKFQAITTFGAPYGFFFGEQPRMVQFQAVLLNTADFQWTVEWWENYESYLRGTKLTSRGMRAYMTYDDVVLEGYLTQAATMTSTSQPYQVDLTFGMWVTNVSYLVSPGDRKAKVNIVPQGATQVSNNGEFVSTTAAVRAQNLQARSSSGIGLLASLRRGLAQAAQGQFVGNQVGDAISGVVNFLYGRNLVIPAGFAGSERIAGRASFAPESGAEPLLADRQSLNITVPGTITGDVNAGRDLVFYDNIDEYPARAGAPGQFQSDSGSEGELSTEDEQNLVYTQLAEATFSEFGYDITNQQGSAVSDTLRNVGRASYGALSYSALASGVSRDAAALTVGNVISGLVAADSQQAALEELNQ